MSEIIFGVISCRNINRDIQVLKIHRALEKNLIPKSLLEAQERRFRS